jgi:hypothetical protein
LNRNHRIQEGRPSEHLVVVVVVVVGCWNVAGTVELPTTHALRPQTQDVGRHQLLEATVPTTWQVVQHQTTDVGIACINSSDRQPNSSSIKWVVVVMVGVGVGMGAVQPQTVGQLLVSTASQLVNINSNKGGSSSPVMVGVAEEGKDRLLHSSSSKEEEEKGRNGLVQGVDRRMVEVPPLSRSSNTNNKWRGSSSKCKVCGGRLSLCPEALMKRWSGCARFVLQTIVGYVSRKP